MDGLGQGLGKPCPEGSARVRTLGLVSGGSSRVRRLGWMGTHECVQRRGRTNARSVCGRGGGRTALLLLFLALPVAAPPRSGSYEPIGPPGGGSRRPFLNLDQVSVITNSPRARGPERLVPVKGRTIIIVYLVSDSVTVFHIFTHREGLLTQLRGQLVQISSMVY